MNDESYIKLAIEIAKKGMGSVSPNPLVGAVIIKNERIIGAGFHEKFGGNHAEINAIESAIESIEGATLYINLEPCSHFGKTPPCVDTLIKCKIKRVVIGTLDMNPLVSGKGVRKLKAAGIEVKVGVLENECVCLNKFFFKYITTSYPYVTLKAAQTLDGKIADNNGYSKWITSTQARRYVHELRSKYDAVLVGAGTLRKDNPNLTVRLFEGRNPQRILLDTDFCVKEESKLVQNNSDGNLIIFTSEESFETKRKVKTFQKKGIKIIPIKLEDNHSLNIKDALKEIGKLEIASVLVEGGGEIFTSFIKRNLFDEVLLFLSPKLLGTGLPVIKDIGIKSLKYALKMKIGETEKIGDDLLIELKK